MAGEAGLKGRCLTRTCCRAVSVHRVVTNRCDVRQASRGAVWNFGVVLEVVYEGIIFTNIRSVTLVLKGVPKETHTAARHQLWGYLISKAEAGRKIIVLWLEQSLAVLIGRQKRNSILGQQIGKAVAG